ncbi:MAG TPA: efflux RND transporter periplasmic adaptor subunit [Burkholderiales bacterium]|nr:efflux RND transporter periplasmic adaptor subunit [Burkholderiales bacterium]
MTRRAVVLGAAALAAVAAAGLAAWQRTPLEAWLGLSRPAGFVVVSGNIEAHQSVLSFQSVQARIVELPFDEGQWVKAGTLIARMDDSDYRQQVGVAQAALEVQRRQLAAAEQNEEAAQKTLLSDRADRSLKRLNLKRDESLAQQGFIADSALDQSRTALVQSAAALERDTALAAAAARAVAVARANIGSAQESLRLTQLALGHTVLRAPFDGVILVRQAELGEVVAPQTPIVTLADLDHVWLRAYVNEPDIGKVRFGQPAAVTTDTYPGRRYAGRIAFISSQAEFTPKSVETHEERVTLVYRIRVDVDNPSHELVPGMPADARIELLGP